MRRIGMSRLGVLLALVIALSACKRGSTPSAPPEASKPKAYVGDTLPPLNQQGVPQEGGELVVAMGAEPPSLNYQLDPLDAWGKKINELMMESLARPNPKTWQHEPRLAESWEVSEDKTRLVFHLRKGVTWHDGMPFSADDVIFTFDKLMNPTSKTMAVRSYLEPITRYTKKDEHTVEFELKVPYWFAFDAVAEIFIYPAHIYAKGDFNTHPANRAPVGTGQFAFEKWKTGDRIVLKRNERYFGNVAKLARIVFEYVPDPTVRTQMLRRGDLDVIEKLSPSEWHNMSTDIDIANRFWRLRHVPGSLQWIGWNQDRAIFRDRRVRQAMTLLLNRQDIVSGLRMGLDALAGSWFFPGSPEHDDTIEPWPFDPKRAKKLLDEAGWSDHDGDGIRDRDGQMFRFKFLYPAGPIFYEQLGGLMQTEFKKVGILVDVARVEWAVYTERLRKHDFDACSLLWQMTPRNDPFQVWHSSSIHGGSNFISFRHARSDQILEKARHEFDDTQRVALYHAFNKILHDEQPYTFLFNRYNLSLVSKKFGGIFSTPYGVLSYGDFFLKSDGD